MTNPQKNWLMDAEVQYRVVPIKGRWEVSLVFVNTRDPNQFLIQHLGDYRTKHLAEIHGRYMQQTAARDARGNKKINKDAYDINHN